MLEEIKKILSKREKKKYSGIVLPMNPINRLKEKISESNDNFGIDLKINFPQPAKEIDLEPLTQAIQEQGKHYQEMQEMMEKVMVMGQEEKVQPINVTVAPKIVTPSPAVDFSPLKSVLKTMLLDTKNKSDKIRIIKIKPLRQLKSKNVDSVVLKKLLKRLDEPIYTKGIDHIGGSI